MKKFLAILGGIVIFFVILFSAVFFLTSGMTNVAETFFTAVKSGDMQTAESCLSDGFKATTSMDQLNAFLKSSALEKYKSANWPTRSTEGSKGFLEGTVNTESGDTIPIKIKFIKGENGWKIYAIEKPNAGIIQKKEKEKEKEEITMPTKAQGTALVKKSINEFALSVNEKSMNRFHKHISELWKNQFTVEQLDESFKVFYTAGIDLTVVDNLTPEFDKEPYIDNRNILTISGIFNTSPSKVYFTQNYMQENGQWKLTGFNINVK